MTNVIRENKSATINTLVNWQELSKEDLRKISPAILLRRVSDQSQENGYSLSAQLRYGTQYCVEKNFTILIDYCFTETASKKHLRKNFKKMINDAIQLSKRLGVPVQLIVEKTDRLSRDFSSKEQLQELAAEGKISIHYYKDRRIFDKNCTPADIFNDDIQTAISKYTAKNIARETKKGMKEKAYSGVFPGLAPLGYKNVRTAPDGKNKRGIASIIVDPDQRNVDAVRRIFELRSQNYSYESIRDQILEEKLLPPEKAASISRTGIEKILGNKYYAGEFDWDGETHKGTHPIIIPTEHLEIVFNRAKGGHSNRPAGVLSDFMTCATCGCKVIYDPKTKVLKSTGETKTYHFYHCTDGKGIHRQNKEKQINTTEDAIFTQSEAILDSFTLKQDVLALVAEQLKKLENKSKAERETVLKKNKQAIIALEQKEDDLLQLLLSKSIDEETYKRGRDKIREEKWNASRELERVQEATGSRFELQSDSILELAKKAKLLWNTANTSIRLKILKTILSNQKLNGKVFEFTLKKPFEVLGKMQSLETKKNLTENSEVFLKLWCPGRDLNPYAEALGSKPSVSANFTTWAGCGIVLLEVEPLFKRKFRLVLLLHP